MKDVLKRLAELDSKNPNRPEYKVKSEQVIPSRLKNSNQHTSKIVRENTEQPKYKISDVGRFKNIGKKSIASAMAYDPSNEEEDTSFPVTIEISREDFGVEPTHHDYREVIEVFNSETDENITDLVDLGDLSFDPNYKYRDRDDSRLDECGMAYGSSMMDRPSTPASINITAGSGSELSGMLKDIMSLAGMSKQEPISSPAATVEPDMDDGTTVMRSVMDKLNPKVDGPENEGLAGGIAGGVAGAALTRSPSGAMMGYELGSDLQDAMTSDDSDDSEDKLKEYSNTPKDPTNVPPIGRDAMLNKSMHNQDPAGHPQKGKRMNGTMPRAHADEMYESLMKEYKKFVG